ncbi:L,D-transpeptidase family protein [Nocardioides aequoreus]|uniref:L,D-transpeptidase family protein n=1 Tax=Nocardioides aequoreus TaxID=397278 RepID=UPI0004C37627|nr:L,D-transpeptidase family protein [Nocardioides aequoreus]
MSRTFPWGTSVMVALVLLATSAVGFTLSHRVGDASAQAAAPGETSSASPTPTSLATTPDTAPVRTPERWSGTRATARPAPLPAVRPYAVPAPGPRLLGPGDDSAEVRELQSRLRQIAWVYGDVDDRYDDTLAEAVRGFQEKRRIAETGYVDQRTMDRLLAMTREPTADELANRFPGDVETDAGLDPRCLTGRVLCVDKASSTLRWVVDGQVLRTLAVRFGSEFTPTREGRFSVGWKSRDHVSSLYDTPMPFAMFFSGGQAVHYSADFAATGYAGASHGCVNVRDLPGITWLFDQVRVGDAVVVYWS